MSEPYAPRAAGQSVYRIVEVTEEELEAMKKAPSEVEDVYAFRSDQDHGVHHDHDHGLADHDHDHGTTHHDHDHPPPVFV